MTLVVRRITLGEGFLTVQNVAHTATHAVMGLNVDVCLNWEDLVVRCTHSSVLL